MIPKPNFTVIEREEEYRNFPRPPHSIHFKLLTNHSFFYLKKYRLEIVQKFWSFYCMRWTEWMDLSKREIQDLFILILYKTNKRVFQIWKISKDFYCLFIHLKMVCNLVKRKKNFELFVNGNWNLCRESFPFSFPREVFSTIHT